ncbi:hypothetical protein KSF73_08860 [Burkholderiaceae bacterium DAT-1]|nr:hypothetical protein [Burkholderiaceae bacterium DAT-1]
MADALKTPAVAGNNDAWLAWWLARPIPILKSTKRMFKQLAGRLASVRMDEVVSAVLKDPLLTAYALRAINLRERSSLAADIVSIEATVLMMGMENLIHQFCELPEVEEILLPGHPKVYAELLGEVATARFSARVARTMGGMRYDARLDEIFVTALVARLPAMLRLLEKGYAEKVPSCDPATMTLQLFTRWRLPDVFTALLDESGTLTQRAQLQQAVLYMCDSLQAGWWAAGVDESLDVISRTLSTDRQAVWAEVTRIMLHFAHKDWPYKQIYSPARWLAMLPGPWPDERPKPAQTAKPSFGDYCREIKRAGEGDASFNQIMALTIRALSDAVLLERICFMLLMPGHNAIKTRYVIGAEMSDPLRTLQVELEAPHLVTKLMLKQQSFWMTDQNRPQYAKLVPSALLQAVGKTEFAVMSLHVEEKPVGLFYADKKGASLSEAQYNAFKQVCLLTAQALTTQARRLTAKK